MPSPRRLKVLSLTQLHRLSRPRLLAYRCKVLSLESSPELSDRDPSETSPLDDRYVWFKSDPRWQPVYDAVLAALAHPNPAV